MDIAAIARPPAGLVQGFVGIATSTIANALDEVGHGDSVMPSIKAVAAGFRFAGPAVTVKEIVGPQGTYESKDFAVGTIIDTAEAGDAVVIEGGGTPVSTWGGTASCAAKLKGIAGLVVDGGVRDLEEIVEFDFPVFARHMVPTTGRTRLKVEAIGRPVTVDGVRVEPGDIVVADGTGIVVVPQARAAEVLELARRYADDDARAVADLKNGRTFREVTDKFAKL